MGIHNFVILELRVAKNLSRFLQKVVVQLHHLRFLLLLYVFSVAASCSSPRIRNQTLGT
jgi:hypothetical protein